MKTIKFSLFTWIIIPILGIFITTNYIIGISKKPQWDQNNQQAEKVLGVADFKTPLPIITWHGQGLITFWFDDGWYSQYSIAYPILEKNNIKGAISVALNLIDGDDYVTWPQIKRLQFNGWEIVSHSISHSCETKDLTAKKQLIEIRDSKSKLEENDIYTNIYVAPCGMQNDYVKNTAKNYYIGLRTSADGINNLPVTTPYDLKVHSLNNQTTMHDIKSWLSDAAINKKWLILVFHKIGNGNSKYEITADFFNKIVEESNLYGLESVLPSQALQLIVNEDSSKL